METKTRIFMLSKIILEIFEMMFELKKESLVVVMEQYECREQELHDMLWEEFNIPGMEVRIANTALNFLIIACEKKEDLESTLRKEIHKNVLAAAIYYTNIDPEGI